ncbi:MAG: hypothetical protein MR902_06585 [Campylobacter sp.]|nr:hypothetical protein [Campylobacter sp.]
MAYGIDDQIKEIKKFSKCKNFHYPNILNLDEVIKFSSEFKPDPTTNLSISKNYNQAKAFCDDNFLNKSNYYDFIHLTIYQICHQ